MKRALLAFVVALVVVACSTPAILLPPAGSSGANPCGYQAHSCGNGACCDDDSDCGGDEFPGCPKTMCCYRGDESGRLMAHRPVPQKPAK